MPAKIDLTNKKIGKLFIEREATPQEKNNRPGAYWVCKCDCGNIVVKNGQGLRKGQTTSCGCDLSEKLKKRPRQDFIDETGNKYGLLTVLERDYKEEEKHNNKGYTYWKCKCDCGNIVTIGRSSLKNGQTKSCGCLRKKVMAQRMSDPNNHYYKNEIGNKYGKLTVIEKIYDNGLKWKCLCDCGNEIIVSGNSLRMGNTSSCGCLGRSKGEFLISKILKENNISFAQEYSVNINDRNFRFDFAIFSNNQLEYLIEFDGEQHFKSSKFFGGIEYLHYIQENDLLKNQWCIENNIPLIRIPYSHIKNLCLEDLILSSSKYIC